MKNEDREIFRNLLEKIMRRFRCSSGSIALLDGESQTFRIIASRGLQLERLSQAIDIGKSVTGLIYRNKKAVLIDSQHRLPPEFRYRRKRELCSISLPLLNSENRVIGIISLNKRSGTFSLPKVVVLRLLTQEIAILAEQIHLREEEEKATLSLQKEYAVLLQSFRGSDIGTLLRKITEVSWGHCKAQLVVLHTPLFANAPLVHPPEPILSPTQWDRCQAFLSPHIKKAWSEGTPQTVAMRWEMCPLPRGHFSTAAQGFTAEIYPITYNEKTLGVVLLFLEKPLLPYRRLTLVLLLTLGGLLLQHHLFLRETELSVRRQEQLKLAQDLHNNLAQDLAGIALYVETFKEKVAQRAIQAEEMSAILQKIDLAIHRCLDYSRNVLKTLQRSIDGRQPLEERITENLEHRSLFAEKKLHYTLKVNLPHHTASHDLQETLFQLVIEAVNNVLRHTQANKVHIKIGSWRDKVYLLVRDDGQGFDAQNFTLTHGLHLMHQRVLLHKGLLRISSAKGKGTTVKVVLPIYG